MFLRQFIDLGLYKSSCILFSCLFFVSCNTVNNKPAEVVSNVSSRKIASLSAAAMAVNSSAFMAMQGCPVLTSIQSIVQAGNYNARQIMNMMNIKNNDGTTFQQGLMSEFASNSDCLSRISELRENICAYREYNEFCANLFQLHKINRKDFIREFEEFAGASIESIDSNELADKIAEFVNSRDSFIGKIVDEISDQPHILIPGAGIIVTLALAAPVAATIAAGGLIGVAVTTVFSLAGWTIHNKDVRNRRR